MQNAHFDHWDHRSTKLGIMITLPKQIWYQCYWPGGNVTMATMTKFAYTSPSIIKCFYLWREKCWNEWHQCPIILVDYVDNNFKNTLTYHA